MSIICNERRYRMKIGIMQPYFLPYLGYLSLINHTDKFILFDTVQFINHGWIERNRILKPNMGWQYISVPLKKHNRVDKIEEVYINHNIDWKDKIFRQLEHYKTKAPFYDETMRTLKEAFDVEAETISALNMHILKVICRYIGIEFNIEIFSKMNLQIDEAKAPDEWALNICKALGNVEEYWNPEGGLEFFERSKYEKENIKINFLKMNLKKYPQRRASFETGLSIVDVMMFNAPSEICIMLDDYELL